MLKNVPFSQAFISRGPQQVIALNKIDAILGVFQKLIASRSNDHEGFYLLQSIVEFFPAAVFANYAKPVFMLLFQRLTSSKTTKFVRNFLVFMYLYVVKHDGAALINTVDSIQASMFGMVCERLVVPETQKVTGNTEKKICAVGLTKLLCETPALLDGQYANFWPKILETLVGLFELPSDESTAADEHFVEIEDTQGYQSAYSVLVFAGKRDHDPVAGVGDARAALAQSLHKLSAGRPGMVMPLVGQMNPQARDFLVKYLQASNLNLS